VFHSPVPWLWIWALGSIGRGRGKASPPAWTGARAAPHALPSPEKREEGSRAPTGAGAEAAAPGDLPRDRSISGSPEITDRERPAGAPLGALLRHFSAPVRASRIGIRADPSSEHLAQGS
jgi:hypothetical protein